jgi:Tfp pilus assembly protein FimT
VRTSRRKLRAFTLIELLAASICLASASIGVLSALRFANDRSIAARYRLLASQRAASEIDLARGKALSSTLAAGTTVQTLNNTGIPGPLTVTTTIAAVTGSPDLYTVRAVSSWNGASQSVTFDSLVRFGNVN